MKRMKWAFAVIAAVTVFLGSTHRGITQGTLIDNVYASGTINTANCNQAPSGSCQGGSAANGGAGPNLDNIQATVSLCEVDGRLTGNGTGTGFRFGKTNISLLYKNGNTATCSRFPDNVPATLQNAANPLSGVDNDFASMMLGIWVVNRDGTATLTVAKQGTAAGLRNYGSVSVREIQTPSPTYYNTNNDPAPQLNALRACGAVAVRGQCFSGGVPCVTPECTTAATGEAN